MTKLKKVRKGPKSLHSVEHFLREMVGNWPQQQMGSGTEDRAPRNGRKKGQQTSQESRNSAQAHRGLSFFLSHGKFEEQMHRVMMKFRKSRQYHTQREREVLLAFEKNLAASAKPYFQESTCMIKMQV